MNLQSLVRDKIIANVKIGTKTESGLPKKLPYFNVEEDKATSIEMVEIFKKLYPDKPTKLKIMFTSENPFNFKYKRYVNKKVVCIGNDTKAITIGKDDKGKNAQVEIECNEECEQRLKGACKLVGSLKFVLVGIDAGGLWKINTSGGLSLSNIATELYKYKKAGMSIVGVPFELTLTEQESLAYGVYYSIDLHRTDIVPKLTGEMVEKNESIVQGNNTQLIEGKTESIKTEAKQEVKQEEAQSSNSVEINKPKESNKSEDKSKKDFSNYFTIDKIMPTIVNNSKFDKVIGFDNNNQKIEYILHPKADQELLKYTRGTIIEITNSKVEANRNVLCKYKILQTITQEELDKIEEKENKELKEAV